MNTPNDKRQWRVVIENGAVIDVPVTDHRDGGFLASATDGNACDATARLAVGRLASEQGWPVREILAPDEVPASAASSAQRYERGIAILKARHGEHFHAQSVCDEYGTMLAGSEIDERVSDAERKELEALGWQWADMYDSWRFRRE